MCHLCNTKSVYEFTNQRKLCKTCFIKYFQKKVFYVIKKFNMIKQGDVIGYVKSNHFRVVVLKEMLKMIAKKLDIKLKELPKSKDSLTKLGIRFGINKLAWASSIDLISYEIVNEIINEDVKDLNVYLPVTKLGKKLSMIKPLALFLDEEILLYAKLTNLKFKHKEPKKDKIELFIDGLEQKHPEVKRAVVNSLLELYKN